MPRHEVTIFADLRGSLTPKVVAVARELHRAHRESLDVSVRIVPEPPFDERHNLAAQAVLAARAQGKDWALLDWMASAPAVDQTSLVAAAQAIGADAARLRSELEGHTWAVAAQADEARALRLPRRCRPVLSTGECLRGRAWPDGVLWRAVVEHYQVTTRQKFAEERLFNAEHRDEDFAAAVEKELGPTLLADFQLVVPGVKLEFLCKSFQCRGFMETTREEGRAADLLISALYCGPPYCQFGHEFFTLMRGLEALAEGKTAADFVSEVLTRRREALNGPRAANLKVPRERFRLD